MGLDQYVAHIDATERPGSVWSAFGKAFRYQFMENTSEKLGSVISALGGDRAVKEALSRLSKPAQERLSKHALFLAIASKNPGKKLETVQKMLARANVDSLPMEMLEEGGSAGLHWMFDGEEFHLPSAEDAASLFVSMLLTGTVMKAASWRDGKEGQGKTDSPGTSLGRALREQSGNETAGAAQQAALATGASAQAPVQAEAGGVTAEGALQGAGGLGMTTEGQATAGVEATAVTGGAVQPRLSFSQGSGGRRLVDRFVNLAALEGRFRRGPKTDAKGLNEVLAHYSLKPGEARLDKADLVRPGVSEAHTIILASGGEAVLNVEGNKVWVDTQGVQGKAATGEGNNQEQELKGGDLVYQAAMTYALNNGLQFSPDPRSVTKKALRRRVSHMLSSALRHGTTKHLSPVSPAYSATTPDKVTKDLVAD